MKIVKRVLTLIMILAITMSFNVVKAAGSTMKLTATQTTINVGDTVDIYLSLQGFTDIQGLTAVGGTLRFDSSVLEYKSIASENGWSSISYNKDNGKFITTQDNPTGKGNIFKVTFTIIAMPPSGETTVSVVNFDVTDNETDEITTSDVSVTLGIKNKEPDNPGTNPDDPGTNPDNPGTNPDDPGTNPDNPGTNPDNPGTNPDDPGTNPDDPGTNPDNPGTNPDNPGTNPDNPGTNPDNPGTNPNNPGTNPNNPGNSGNSGNSGNQGTNNGGNSANKGNSGTNKDNTTASGRIPQAGVQGITLGLIAAISAVGVVTFIRYKNIDK